MHSVLTHKQLDKTVSLRSVPPPFVTAFGLLRETAGRVTKPALSKAEGGAVLLRNL